MDQQLSLCAFIIGSVQESSLGFNILGDLDRLHLLMMIIMIPIIIESSDASTFEHIATDS